MYVGRSFSLGKPGKLHCLTKIVHHHVDDLVNFAMELVLTHLCIAWIYWRKKVHLYSNGRALVAS